MDTLGRLLVRSRERARSVRMDTSVETTLVRMRSKAVSFDGVRAHEKVFIPCPPVFLCIYPLLFSLISCLQWAGPGRTRHGNTEYSEVNVPLEKDVRVREK